MFHYVPIITSCYNGCYIMILRQETVQFMPHQKDRHLLSNTRKNHFKLISQHKTLLGLINHLDHSIVNIKHMKVKYMCASTETK